MASVRKILPATLLALDELFGERGEAQLTARAYAALRLLYRPGDPLPPMRRLRAELRERLGIRDLCAPQIQRVLERLRAAGLIAGGPALAFPTPDRAASREGLARQLGRRGRLLWGTPIDVTDGQLRDLAACRAPGRAAVLLAALMRCEFDADAVGRCSLSLMAAAARVSRSSVKRGKRRLKADGKLLPLALDPRNAAYWRAGARIQLGEDAAPRGRRRRRPAAGVAAPSRQSDPISAAGVGKVAPSSHELLRSSPTPPAAIAQRTAARAAAADGRGAAGVLCERAARRETAPRPAQTSTKGRPTPKRPAAAAKPRWPDLTPADLEDPHRLLREVMPVAVARGALPATTHGRQQLLVRAAAALRLGRRNPCGWFVAALERGDPSWAADVDHDRARALWRARESEREERARTAGALSRGRAHAAVDAILAGLRRRAG